MFQLHDESVQRGAPRELSTKMEKTVSAKNCVTSFLLVACVSTAFGGEIPAGKSLLQQVEKWKYPTSKVEGLEIGPGKMFDHEGNRVISSTQCKATFTTPDSVGTVLSHYRERLKHELGKVRPRETIDEVGSMGRSVTFQSGIRGNESSLQIVMVNDHRKSTTLVISRDDDKSLTHVSWSQFCKYSIEDADNSPPEPNGKGYVIPLKNKGDDVRTGEVIAHVFRITSADEQLIEIDEKARAVIRSIEKRLSVAKECVVALKSYIAATKRIRDNRAKTDSSRTADNSENELSIEIRESRASLDYATYEYDRQKKLYDERLASHSSLMKAKLAYELSKAKWDRSRNLLKQSGYPAEIDNSTAVESFSELIARARVEHAVSERRIAEAQVALIEVQLTKARFDLQVDRVSAPFTRVFKSKTSVKATADGVVSEFTKNSILNPGDMVCRFLKNNAGGVSKDVIVRWKPQ